MQAAHTVCRGLGKNIIVSERPTPRVKSNQVLIDVRASSVNPLNYAVHQGIKHVPLLNIVPGHDVAGVVTQVGHGVTDLQVGDQVFGCMPGLFGGAFSQLVAMPAAAVAIKPENLTMLEAASIPLVALTAVQAFRNAGLKSGDSVLIIGASGGVGTMAVQIAKALGASVTGVCSTGNLELVRSLGADTVVDYTQTRIQDLSPRFNVVFDIIGEESMSSCSRILTSDGCYVTTQYSARSMLDWMLTSLRSTNGRRSRIVSMRPRREDLQQIAGLIEAGKVKPVIDRCYSLSEVSEAFEYSASKRVKGKIVIDLC